LQTGKYNGLQIAHPLLGDSTTWMLQNLHSWNSYRHTDGIPAFHVA